MDAKETLWRYAPVGRVRQPDADMWATADEYPAQIVQLYRDVQARADAAISEPTTPGVRGTWLACGDGIALGAGDRLTSVGRSAAPRVGVCVRHQGLEPRTR